MEAKDLRIGNYVQSKLNGLSIVTQIGSSINDNYIGARTIEGNYWENSHLPVEITEDWLYSLGFEYSVAGIFKLGDFTLIKWSGENAEFNNFDAVGNKRHCITLKYVHELQNLYFSLTNKELKQK